MQQKDITIIPPDPKYDSHIRIEHKTLNVAAYCRVSTRFEQQENSYDAQIAYYTRKIGMNKSWNCAGIYADEGKAATGTKFRDSFNDMIEDCYAGKIDLILTKSISRFARNTVDCLRIIRELKERQIRILFEKENINTLDAKGEVLLTILSSLAQDESRSISENSTWGIRRRFESGQFKMSTKRFLGYDTDENGKLVINREQAKIVERIYDEYLSGKTVDHIKRILEREEVKNWNGTTKWHAKTIQSMLQNEKYKGDAILQKSYTVDFLTKKRVKNEGRIQQYHIEENHEAIIDPLIWEAVQLEYDRRSKYIEEHGTNSYSHNPEKNLFAGKVVCGTCNQAFTRKGWKSKNSYRKVWQCQERYKVKGVQGCTNRHIDEAILIDAFILSWNALLDNREELRKKWETTAEFGNPLEQYRAVQFADITEDAKHIKEIDTDFILRTLDHIKVYETGRIIIRFMDGTDIERNGE